MSAAYKVTYCGPKGRPCPDAVVTFDGDAGEDIAELAPKIRGILQDARGHGWDGTADVWRVTISRIEYLGPWFNGAGR